MKNSIGLFGFLFIYLSSIMAQADTILSNTVTLSDTIKVHYTDEGEGSATLLFLHGLGSNHKAWQKNIVDLKKQYRCIAVDYPGYGASSKGNYDFSMPFFAQTVRQLIDTLALENVVLVGHSMGAQIVFRLLLQDAAKIKKLVLFAPAGIEQFSVENRQWFQSIYTPTMLQSASKEQIVQGFHLNFASMPEDAQFMIDDRLALRASDEYAYYCRMIPKCVMGMLEGPVFDQLGQVKVPTLVVFGHQDMLIPNRLLHPQSTTEQIAQLAKKAIPNATLKMLDQAGHFVQWEQSATVNALVLDFLKEK
ncbi:MAG: alpha/beta hydrolase [Bacteroidota bacterium]